MGAGGFAALLLVGILVFLPVKAKAAANAGGQISVGISVSFGPPPLPVYTQPMCPGPGYMWTPGYWAWSPGYGYYWVPGTWVRPPYRGALWTPGYWGWDPVQLVFMWHSGYWGPRVGFYGGIDYGFGYPGRGYYGGYWDHDHFFYNRAVNRLDPRFIHHFYDRHDFHRDDRWGRVSYNGGRGGITDRPTWRDMRAEHDRRMGPMSEQFRQRRLARQMPGARWSENHGRPRIAATDRPGRFHGPHAIRASRAGGPWRAQQFRDRGGRQNGQWHVFHRQDGGRQQPMQRAGYRSFGQKGQRAGGQHGFAQRGYQQRGDAGRQRTQRFQQQQQRTYRGRQQTQRNQQQRTYRGRQGRNFSRRSNGGNGRQMVRGRQGGRGGAQQRRGGAQQQRRGGNQTRRGGPRGGQDHGGNQHGRGGNQHGRNHHHL